MKFTKMHGAGNDYIYVYTPECPIENPAEVSVALSRPHFGIGAHPACPRRRLAGQRDSESDGKGASRRPHQLYLAQYVHHSIGL